jgi:hypothetical protein
VRCNQLQALESDERKPKQTLMICGVLVACACQHRFMAAREGVREGSLRVLQLVRCGAVWIEVMQRVFCRSCRLCLRGGGLHVVSRCSRYGVVGMYTNASDVDEMALTDPS